MPDNNFCLLVNPIAGGGRTLQILQQVKDALTACHIHFRTIITDNVEQAKHAAIEAVSRQESVAALGGDGTVRAVAKILSSLGGKLAIIPSGRGNDLVKTLGIPVDHITACKTIAQQNIISIDMAKINGQCFLGICSLGFDSIANLIANTTRLFKGPAAYLYGGLRALVNWQHTTFRLDIDGHLMEHVGYTVAIANAKCYGGGMYLAPQASLHDGLLDIVLIGKVPKYKILMNIPRLFNKTIAHTKGITYLQGKNIKILADPKFIMYADGDPISATPIEISVLPRALSVYAPR